ncbi:hypothetical protein QUF79_13180 [Fictibacillus enclensis]|uniref:hypothetical protein n=1 Tax=Fictibacillus enclensis TaxID=1017270 RepID=UPI0025A29F74|nr:hypothetical protein [Fictibacillus enclensis]MDM5198974.1 hypothetical protein [Fictibacillus enclensis]
MNGLQILNDILAYLARENSDWDTALSGNVNSDVPSDRSLSINGAVLHWSSVFDSLFINGFNATGFDMASLVKVPCSLDIQNKIELVDSGVTKATLYPNILGYLNENDAKEFFINNLNKCLPAEKITTYMSLDEMVETIPFVSYIPIEKENAEYNALKLGYTFETRGSFTWFQDPAHQGTMGNLAECRNQRLFDLFKIAMQTGDVYHQFIELYHLIEYMFYEGLLQRLIALKSSNPGQFYREMGSRSKEHQMFKYVFEQLAKQKGFTGVLNVSGINSCAPGIVSTFCSSLSATDSNSWCDFLYKIRCGIVHTKEGEDFFERTAINDQLLCDYLLPFMRELSVFLIETP